jgi:transposase-like protein
LNEGFSSLTEFVSRFNTDKVCIDYLFQVKWPNGFVCPRCDYRHFCKITRRRLPLYQCAHCRHQTSLTAGTVMEGSRTPLHKWFVTFFLISDPSHGISALQLKKHIQVTYKTAWLMLHKIRHAMSEADASVLLSGFIHVHDASYAHPPYLSAPHHPKEQPLLVGASMIDEQGPKYIKMKLVAPHHLQNKVIHRAGMEAFMEQYVESDTSTIEFITQRVKPRKLKKLYPFFVQTKQWITQTFHGLGPLHLQAYLNEFCYRLNLKLQKQSVFANLVPLCLNCRRITYSTLISHYCLPLAC